MRVVLRELRLFIAAAWWDARVGAKWLREERRREILRRARDQAAEL